MERIFRGVEHYQNHVFPKERHIYQGLAKKQTPIALMISCSDSRVDPNRITQTNPGELFVCRNVGNIVPPWGTAAGGVSATIEYAVVVLNVQAIIVCGHSDCGAMKGLMDHANLQPGSVVGAWLHHAERARAVVEHLTPEADPETRLRMMTEQNVIAQVDHLRTHPSVAARFAGGKLQLLGLVFDIEHGQLRWFDQATARFLPKGEVPQVAEQGSILSVA